MDQLTLVLLSMTLSGSAMALIFTLFRALSKRAGGSGLRYWLWLLVVLRFLLPFSSQLSAMNLLFATPVAAPQVQGESEALPEQSQSSSHTTYSGRGEVQINNDSVIIGDNVLLYDEELEGTGQDNSQADSPADVLADVIAAVPDPGPLDFLRQYLPTIGIIWCAGAAMLLIRRITNYQSFSKYVQAGWQEVSDPGYLNILGEVCEDLGIRTPLNLCINPLLSSPVLLGFVQPAIVLPGMPEDEETLRCILRHEAVHYKRGDIVYIWLTQLAVCLHWFNPFVHLMSRQIERDRELSCDEAVLRSGGAGKKVYGSTLLQSFELGGKYKERHAAAALFENAAALKERLDAIHRYHRPSVTARIITALFGVMLLATGVALGAYTPGSPLTRPIESVAEVDPILPAAEESPEEAEETAQSEEEPTPIPEDRPSEVEEEVPAENSGPTVREGTVSERGEGGPTGNRPYPRPGI
ncbi:MAG: M56 family metallopeptidase [Oscillospiraceae bacterium]